MRALPPVVGVSGRQQHDRVGILGPDLPPERACGPVDRGAVAGEQAVPVGQLTVHRGMPDRNVIGTAEDLHHVVAGPAEQLFECGFE